MRPDRARAGLALAVAAALAAPLATFGVDATSPVGLALDLSPSGPLPAERWRAEARAGTGIVEVLFQVDGRVVARDRRAPFHATVRLEPPLARPTWIEAIGFDAEGRELDRDGHCVHLPADLPTLRVVPTGAGDYRALVEPPVGHAVARVELLLLDGRAVSPHLSPPYRFAPADHESWGVRATFDDGRRIESWQSGESSSEVVEVRLGQARWLAPAGAPPPDAGSLRALFERRPQRILRLVGGEGSGLELGLALDVSESSGRRFDELKGAARHLATSLLGPADRSFLVTFSQDAELVAAARGDLAGVLAAVPTKVRVDKTRIYEGLAYALLQFHAEDPRAALVVLTDGCDTTAVPDDDRVRDLARERSIPIYALLLQEDCFKFITTRDNFGHLQSRVIADPGLTGRSRDRLAKLAEATGGRVVPLDVGSALDDALRQILTELGRQWLVVFEPDAAGVRSEEVEIRIAEPSKPQ